MSKKAFCLLTLTLTLAAATLIPAHHHPMLGPSIASADDLSLDDFVLYAEEDVKLEMIAESIGHVGSNGEANIEEGTSGTLIGHLHALDRIRNKGVITIDGDVVTNEYIDDDGVLTVTGQMIEYANLAPLSIPSPSFSAGGPDIEVPVGGVHTLSPGSYGRIKVRACADLYLSSGDYYIDELDTDPQAIVWVDLTGGPITINVVTELDIDDGVAIIIRPEDSGTTTDITINALQEEKIEIEYDATLRGTLIAPNAKVKFEDNSSLEGAVYAREISLDSGVSFIHHDYYVPLQLTDPSINYRSIGTAGGILHQTGEATVIAQSTQVTFTGTTLPATVGQGDRLTLEPGTDSEEVLYILTRTTDTQLILQGPTSKDHTSAPYAITRAYTTLQAWEDDREGNLVAENRLEVGVCYHDGPFPGGGAYALLTIDDSKTDANHFMWLTVAEGHRHNGTAGTGAVLDGEDTSKIGVRVRDDYTRVEWLEMKRFRSEHGAAGVEVKDARNVLLGELLIHDFQSASCSVVGIKGSNESDFVARNCVIYDGDTAAIRTNQPDGTATITNCTIYGMAERGLYEDDGIFTVTNTISMGNGSEDFDIVRGVQTCNLSSDDTAQGSGCLSNKTASNQFISTASGAEDLHLKEGSHAIDAGEELSTEFAHDIDGDSRPLGVGWDMGADEFVSQANTPPVATDDTATTAMDIPIDIDVLANDIDLDQDTLSVSEVTQGAHGTVAINADNTVKYTPNPGFTGTDSFTYTASDGSGGEDSATVTVEVVAPPEDVDQGIPDDDQQGGAGLVGETICILNGTNVESRSDLAFPSPNSLGLSFEAFYNSRSQSLGTLGYGWTHTYDISLDPVFKIEGKGFLKIVDQKGRAHYFLEESPGLYSGAFKETSHVTVEAGDYIWYRLDGTRYGFLPSGQLIWIEDEKGNRLELVYDAQGRLDTITDTASGRMLTLNYNGDGLLEYIEGPVTPAVPDGIWVSYSYDLNQNLISVTYADGSGFYYAYTDLNDVHNLTEKRGKLSHLLSTWSYDDQDRAVGRFSAEGKGVTSITYVSDTLVEVTDAYGTVRTYSLGEVAGRKRVTALQGTASAPYTGDTIIRWVYDDDLNLIEVETAGGTINQYQDFDERGNPGTVRLAVGTPQERVITYTYHPTMKVPLTRTEPSVLALGSKGTIWDYDDDYDTTPNEYPTSLPSRIVEQGYTKDGSGATVPFEYISTFTYNGKGQVLAIDGPLPGSDDTTDFVYHAATGDLLSITQPLIGSTTFSDYDAVGRVGRVTDVNGEAKGFTYDAKGRVTTITSEADGSSTTISYNAAGRPDTITDEDGVTRTYDYDGNGRLTRITDGEGNYIAYAYDSQGNRIEMSKHDHSGTRTSRKRWSYEQPDVPGMLWKEINVDDTFTEYGYDSEGNIASVKDPNGNTTYYAYDPLNRLISVTQPGSVTTTYTYDTHGNLTAVTDANGNATTYGCDDMGRLVSTTSPDTGAVTYVYDAAGNPIQKTDAKGIAVNYTYDLLSRLTAVHFSDPTADITYSYDAGTYGKGRRTGITDPSGDTTFGYDARGRLAQKNSTILGHGYTMGTSYSPGSRVMSVTYPSSRTLDYTRDSMGRMQGLSTTYNTNTATLVSNMTYNPFGSPKGLNTGVGGVVNNQSGQGGYIEVANPGEQMERIYTYDSNRNLINIQGTNTPWYNQTFTYEALNRLTDATGRYGVINYTYDNVGNRSTRTVIGETENYTYIGGSNKLQEITGANPVTFTYDANGNTTGVGNKTLTYNQNNRLIRVEENSLVLGEYTYNGLGQRVIKTVDGTTTVFHYDLNGKLIAESLPDGTITAEYLYMGKIRIAKVDVSTGNVYYYLNDRLGTPQIMTDDNGTIVWEATYKPFGEATVNPKSTIVNNFRFPGQYDDEETGLHYNYFRYYDPRTGRYVRPDPIGLVGGINLYPYVQNNPVNNVDPEGEIIISLPVIGAYFCLAAIAAAYVEWWYWATHPPDPCEERDREPKIAVNPKLKVIPGPPKPRRPPPATLRR